MSLRRREQLVRLARKYSALIITDDVYDQLQWPVNESSPSPIQHAILPRIVDIDRDMDVGPEEGAEDGFGNAVSNGSFSKIAGPGCRTGWAEGTAKFAWGLSQWLVLSHHFVSLQLMQTAARRNRAERRHNYVLPLWPVYFSPANSSVMFFTPCSPHTHADIEFWYLQFNSTYCLWVFSCHRAIAK